MSNDVEDEEQGRHWLTLGLGVALLWLCSLLCLWGGIASGIAGVGGFTGDRVATWWAPGGIALGLLGVVTRAWSEFGTSSRSGYALVIVAVLIVAWAGTGVVAGAFG